MLRKSLLLSALAIFGAAQATEIGSARGVVDVPNQPQTVAAYDLGVIDTLDAIGVAVAGVPDKTYVDYLDLSQAEVVGTLFEPNLEALNALAPDWVVVAARSAAKFDAVSQIVPAADLTLSGENLFNESLQRLADLGQVFAKETQAEAVKERLVALRDRVAAKVPTENKALMLLVSGPKIAVYGPDSRGGWLGQELGFNLVESEKDASAHGEPVSFEYIADTNPDWLLVIDRAAAIGQDDVSAAEAILDNPLVAQTTAWQKGQVVYIDPAAMYIAIGGVQGIERVLQQIEAVLDR
ncbi:siderophore ABC transporter substrate-binding protein [Suttonella sp. R2A3]|uniref:siderophore ABC transporter substrate-binding protein n=1 Tax=Suttonella sp. R2A3 TaxID=2908648 RepID=UPI001F40D313|nr:siderophore ABC transporter substrate-binding protein [Suttonella sp. R2A3]UJF25075.1 siderophore ABC transporter substrate-binding protein [Suttonella sp. R2A3]